MLLVRYVCLYPSVNIALTRSVTDLIPQIETKLGPLELLDTLQGIENGLGRKKVIDKGPRNIDLDILLYDNESIAHPRLNIPHKLMLERDFVLRPLSQYVLESVRSVLFNRHHAANHFWVQLQTDTA